MEKRTRATILLPITAKTLRIRDAIFDILLEKLGIDGCAYVSEYPSPVSGIWYDREKGSYCRDANVCVMVFDFAPEKVPDFQRYMLRPRAPTARSAILPAQPVSKPDRWNPAF